ncbi:MAG: signal peptidase II [bacterium]|nr:signal peptidase II [bacterium]
MARTGLVIAATVVALDQLTKAWAVATFTDGSTSLIGDFLSFRVTRNPGAAFSSFQGGGAALGLIAAIVAISVAVILPKIEVPLERIALSLVMGGALGNFTDRIFRGDGFLDGAVVDFVDLWIIPTFNVADSAISVGVALMLASALFSKEPRE